MTPRIQKAIDIFLDAINERTLTKGNCAACAVGNLVATGMNIKLRPYTLCENSNSDWGNLFYTDETGCQVYRKDLLSPTALKKAMDNIEATDFTETELMRIEHAFETNTKIRHESYYRYQKEQIRQDQIKGLAAVVEVMLEMDNCTENTKEVFTKKAELIPI